MIQVTAITAAYNAASYIENCIQSVLAQTVPCRMIIVTMHPGMTRMPLPCAMQKSIPTGSWC